MSRVIQCRVGERPAVRAALYTGDLIIAELAAQRGDA